MNTAPRPVSDKPVLPTLEELTQRVRDLEHLTQLLTQKRQERADEYYDPIPPCK